MYKGSPNGEAVVFRVKVAGLREKAPHLNLQSLRTLILPVLALPQLITIHYLPSDYKTVCKTGYPC